jgi:hypothetical protein
MTKPITPKEALKNKGSHIPDFVIEAFNQLITENFDGHSAIIDQEDALERICERMVDVPDLTEAPASEKRTAIFEHGWLDVEPLFRKAGWRVVYDKPGYNETYDAFYEFRKK